jgi:hypothetical protein
MPLPGREEDWLIAGALFALALAILLCEWIRR